MKFYWHFSDKSGLYSPPSRWSPDCLRRSIEASLFTYMGELVDLVRAAPDPRRSSTITGCCCRGWPVALLLRPLAFGVHTIFVNQTINLNVQTQVRWRTHRYVLRQSLSFFQNDFAGRVANKVMQTGPALRADRDADRRRHVVRRRLCRRARWCCSSQADWRLMTAALAVGGGLRRLTLRYFVPRIRDLAAITSEARSTLVGPHRGQLHQHPDGEAVRPYRWRGRLRPGGHDRPDRARCTDQLRIITGMEIVMWVLNGMLIVGTTGLALWLWSGGLITHRRHRACRPASSSASTTWRAGSCGW